jgi:hypothetical protein
MTSSASSREVDINHAGLLPRRAVGAVLGLADQVPGDDVRIGGFVGDHHHLRGAGEEVDPDPAIEQALGLGDVLVARPHQDIGRLAGEQAEGHGGHALNAAHGQNGINAGEVERVEHRRVDAGLVARRRAGDDLVDAGDLGSGHAHDRRGHVAIPPARHVAARRLHRDQPLAGPEPGRELGLELGQAVELRLREAAHAVMGKLDIVLQLRRDAPGGRVDCCLGDDGLALPTVELAAVFDGFLLAAGLDLGKHAGDKVAHALLARGGGLGGLLDVFDRHVLILVASVLMFPSACPPAAHSVRTARAAVLRAAVR